MLYFTIIALYLLTVMLHEAGHMISASMFGIKTKEFSVGLGPRLLSFRIKDTRYSLKLLPIGGSCDIPKERIEELPPVKQVIIYLAGCAVNGVVGVILTAISLVIGCGVTEGLSKLPYVIYKMITLPFTAYEAYTQLAVTDLTGPVRAVSIMHDMSTATEKPYAWVFLFMGFMSFFVMELNLLPLPPLDGGEIVSVILSRIFGRHEKLKLAISLTVIGFVLFITFVSFLNDAFYIAGALP